MSQPPKTIYLQWTPAPPPDGITWCEDRIHEDDIEYVMSSVCQQMLEALERVQFYFKYDKYAISLDLRQMIEAAIKIGKGA